GKVILEAPYTSAVDLAGALFPIAPVSLFMRDRFHSDRRIARVTAPLLVMHGTRPFPSFSASGCLRWRTSTSNSCAFPEAGIMTSTISARSAWRYDSSIPEEADGRRFMAHSAARI